MQIYTTTVRTMGPNVKDFGDEMLILFGESAPETLKNYCYTINTNKAEGIIAPGQTLLFDDTPYTITCVGESAQTNLEGLGHLTVNFTGDPAGCLPGAVVVEKSAAPNIEVGTVIRITE